MYDLKLMSFFVLRIIIMILLAIIASKIIWQQEYSNCHIDWLKYRTLPNKTRLKTKLIGFWLPELYLVALAAEQVIRRKAIYRADLADAYAIMTVLALLLATAGYAEFYFGTVETVRNACISRNRKKLARLQATREAEADRRRFNMKFNYELI